MGTQSDRKDHGHSSDVAAGNGSATGGQAPGRDIVITRLIAAPRELVWRAWTEPEHLMRWFAPGPYTAPFSKVDLRPGGQFRYCMRSPEGQEFWGKGVYREIVPPERLVYVDSFTDADGNTVSAAHYGMDPQIPMETIVTVTLAQEGDTTRLVLRHSGVPRSEHGDLAEVGWNMQLDKLADVLAEVQRESER